MHDAHFHLSDRLEKILVETGMMGILNTRNISEYHYALDLVDKCPNLKISAGVHPWDAGKVSIDEMTPAFYTADYIGEAGLDSEWTTTLMGGQKSLFKKQIAFAYSVKKPLILHTKGMEREVFKMIKNYPNTYIVHWYSGALEPEENILDFISMGAYFTIGPSVGIDPNVDRVCRMVPEDRLLLESDGIEGIAWARSLDKDSLDYIQEMKNTIAEIAAIRGRTEKEMEGILDENFRNIY